MLIRRVWDRACGRGQAQVLAPEGSLFAVRSDATGPKRQFAARNHTSEVGGEADMPTQLNRRV